MDFQSGNIDQYRIKVKNAIKVLDYISSQIEDESMRNSFLKVDNIANLYNQYRRLSDE